MYVLVYGYKGWIGKQVCSLLESKGHRWTGGQSRVDDIYALKHELNRVKEYVTHVFCVIGRTHGGGINTIDYLEGPGKLVDNIRDNLFAPVILAMLCKDLGLHMTYIGTGCIFSSVNDAGELVVRDGGYDEKSDPDFFGSSYSIVKGFTDRIMVGVLDSCLNVRIRMPITGECNGRNFITKIVGYSKICSISNSMTVLDDLMPIVLDMMEDGVTGTYNMVNPGVISHNEILEMYRELVDPGFQWQNMNLTEQDGVLACKRSNNKLDTLKLENYILSKYGCEIGGRMINDLAIGNSIRQALIRYAGCSNIVKYSERVVALTDSFFKGVVILVTGGCGFIGSNFINYMLGKYRGIGLRIINIDALYYCASEDNIEPWIRALGEKHYKFIKCNIQQREFVEYIFREEKPDYVIHFAAQSHVDNSFNGALSMDYTMDNVLGTHVIMEVCRQYLNKGGRLQKIIHVSTDEVYGESRMDDCNEKTEHSVLCPTNPYAASKAGAEMVVMSYKHSFGLPVIISRGNNVFGPNQYPEKLIPKWLSLLDTGKKLTIAGSGDQLRSFLWVDDVSSAFEVMLEKGVVGEIYNIGSVEEYSVKHVAAILLELKYGAGVNIDDYVEYIPDRPFNDKRYFISNDKLCALGWKPLMNFIDGLKKLLNL